MSTGSRAAVILRRALVAATLLVLVGAVPTRALEAEYDGAYAIFPADRGIVLVELIGSGEARVTLALTGLAPNADYSLLWSKARCGRSSSASKTVLELDLTTNGAGAAYRAEVVPWLWAAVAPDPKAPGWHVTEPRVNPVPGLTPLVTPMAMDPCRARITRSSTMARAGASSSLNDWATRPAIFRGRCRVSSRASPTD